MNRYLATLLIFALLLCSLLGCTTVAYASTGDSVSDIHLVNPSSVAVIGDTLYIADNVTNSSSVILLFDISGTTPLYTDMIEYDGNISQMRVYDNTLYIIFADRYIAWNTTTNTNTSYNTAIQDIAIMQYNNTTYTYTISNNTVYRGTTDKWQADSVVIIDTTMYLLYGNTTATITLVDSDGINEPNTAGYTATEYTYLTTDGKTLVSCSSSNVYIDNTLSDITLSDIDCVATHNNSILALHNNQLTQYASSNNSYTEGYTIGSDTVSIDAPTLDDITGYTLVVSTGYPTNIVYKTTGDNSISELIELSNEPVWVLSWYGSEVCNYYYVYTDNGFGWIKKGATTLSAESTLTTSDTSINGSMSYTAKLISAYSVTIYSLPTTSYVRTTFTQSTTEPTTVTLLQQTTDSASTTWYYISYILNGTTQYGFVKSGDIGYIYSSGTTDNVVLDSDTPYLKIDSTMQGDVYMYLTSELSAGTELVDSSDSTIVLAGNTRVSVITVGENSSYIQITTDSGTYYGWVDNNCLISTSALTTSTIVGLVLLGVAILLIVATVTIVKKRKNNLVASDIL